MELPSALSLGHPAASRCASKGSILERSPERVSPAVSSGCRDDLMTPLLADRASICMQDSLVRFTDQEPLLSRWAPKGWNDASCGMSAVPLLRKLVKLEGL